MHAAFLLSVGSHWQPTGSNFSLTHSQQRALALHQVLLTQLNCWFVHFTGINSFAIAMRPLLKIAPGLLVALLKRFSMLISCWSNICKIGNCPPSCNWTDQNLCCFVCSFLFHFSNLWAILFRASFSISLQSGSSSFSLLKISSRVWSWPVEMFWAHKRKITSI